jgi:hypothetical protein
MNRSFYLTLQSDGISHVECKNTCDSFTIHLGHSLDLRGTWEVGLADIHFPMTMSSIQFSEGIIMVQDWRQELNKIEIIDLRPNGQNSCHYDNDRIFRELSTQLKHLGIEATLVNGHLMLYLPKSDDAFGNVELVVSEKMQLILGLDDVSSVFSHSNDTVLASKPIDVLRGLPQQLFIYTDIIQHQRVGSSFEKILRIVPVDTTNYRDGALKGVNFTKINYLPLCSENIYSVNVNIKDRSNFPISFQSGTSTVTLHFRKIKND